MPYTLPQQSNNDIKNHSTTRNEIMPYTGNDCIMQMRLLRIYKIMDSLESPQVKHNGKLSF